MDQGGQTEGKEDEKNRCETRRVCFLFCRYLRYVYSKLMGLFRRKHLASCMFRVKSSNARKQSGLGYAESFYNTFRLLSNVFFQDIRDFVLHLIADAPPVGWVRVEVSISIRECMVEL